MKIMYVDHNGESMCMTAQDKSIVIPVLCKEYDSFQHTMVVTIAPGVSEFKQILKAQRKRKENMKFTHLEMRLEGEVDDITSWQLYGNEQFEGESAELFKGSWISRLESWHKQYCTLAGLNTIQNATTLADTFYLKNVVVSGCKNCAIHLFGNCKVWKASLSNVILYIHGECDEV